ncbi:MAG: LPS-assembly protein LptD [Candidatus Methylacidiphilales bacterium]|nr:LPS assembly protein LptD [Candidatus Methylacidiphilales bacterium]
MAFAQDGQLPSLPPGPNLYEPQNETATPTASEPSPLFPPGMPSVQDTYDPSVPAPLFTPLPENQELPEGKTPEMVAQDSIEIKSDGETNFDRDTGIAVATGNVVVRYKGTEIFADYIMLNNKTKDLFCRGNVRIYSANDIYRGEAMDYNLGTGERKSLDFRLGGGQVLTSGLTMKTIDTKRHIQQIHKGVFAVDNREDPMFHFKANTVNVYENEKVVLRNVTFYIGDVPFMWLPIYVQSLRSQKEGYTWTPGYSDRFGYFLLNRYGIIVDEKLSVMLHGDYRETRGPAVGVDFEYVGNKEDSKDKYFNSQLYYAHDAIYESGVDSTSKAASFRYPNVSSENRYVADFKGRTSFMKDSWILADLNVWSDPYVTLDYFPTAYSANREPDNVVEAVQYTPNWTADLLVRMQLNDFFETVERKPDVKWEAKRQRLFDTPVSYEGETGVVAFERRFAKLADEPARRGTGYSNYRYDTFHQFLYPKQYFNFLSFTPRVGLRGTYWSDNNLNLDDRDSQGFNEKDPTGRFVFNAGFESSFKISRVWSDIKSQQFGIDGIRHVIEPFMNAQFVYTTLDPEDLRGMDDHLPYASTSLPAINFPFYNSVDSINKQAVLRLGVRNKIQTKRDGLNWDLIDWAVSMDYDGYNNFSSTQSNLQFLTDANVKTKSALVEQRSNSAFRNLSNIISDFRFTPVPWLTLSSKAAFDPTIGTFTQFDTDITFQPIRALSVGVAHRYIEDSLLYPDSNQFTINAFYRMNENWQFSSSILLDTNNSTSTAADSTNTSEDYDMIKSQQYSIHRDLSSWIVSLTLKRSQGSVYLDGQAQTDTSVFMTFTLKAFPGASLTTSAYNQ